MSSITDLQDNLKCMGEAIPMKVDINFLIRECQKEKNLNEVIFSRGNKLLTGKEAIPYLIELRDKGIKYIE